MAVLDIKFNVGDNNTSGMLDTTIESRIKLELTSAIRAYTQANEHSILKDGGIVKIELMKSRKRGVS